MFVFSDLYEIVKSGRGSKKDVERSLHALEEYIAAIKKEIDSVVLESLSTTVTMGTKQKCALGNSVHDFVGVPDDVMKRLSIGM